MDDQDWLAPASKNIAGTSAPWPSRCSVLPQMRSEEPLGHHVPDLLVGREDAADPEQDALLADSVGLAFQVVLDTVAPAERLAFVLHDMFDLSFDEIASLLGVLRRPPGSSRVAHGDGCATPAWRARARARAQRGPPASGRRRLLRSRPRRRLRGKALTLALDIPFRLRPFDLGHATGVDVASLATGEARLVGHTTIDVREHLLGSSVGDGDAVPVSISKRRRLPRDEDGEVGLGVRDVVEPDGSPERLRQRDIHAARAAHLQGSDRDAVVIPADVEVCEVRYRLDRQTLVDLGAGNACVPGAREPRGRYGVQVE